MTGFTQGNISVDSDFARFGSKSYAINKINSVEVRETRTDSQNPKIILGLVGALFAFSAVSTVKDDLGSAITFGLIGGTMIALAIYLLRRPAQYLYTLFITTSSTEAQAMQTNDKQQAIELRSAIEAAMAGKLPD